MNPIVEIIFTILFPLIAVFLLILVILWEWSVLMTRAPFIPMPKEVLTRIVEALQIKPDSVVYDLGCGDGRILIAAHQAEPSALYKGVEKNLFPGLLCRINFWRIKAKNKPKLIRKNFFKTDLSSATHIFMYLFTGMPDKLWPKFQQELKPGTRIVSCDFPFTKIQPIQTIDLHRDNKMLAHKLYVYVI